ncbi:MAG TPA: hypothetical protein VII92_17145, partial [Anaerolineae bacterium]
MRGFQFIPDLIRNLARNICPSRIRYTQKRIEIRVIGSIPNRVERSHGASGCIRRTVSGNNILIPNLISSLAWYVCAYTVRYAQKRVQVRIIRAVANRIERSEC